MSSLMIGLTVQLLHPRTLPNVYSWVKGKHLIHVLHLQTTKMEAAIL